jgi:hypothetical protein
MTAKEATSQTCPACGASVDTAAAEPLARVDCPNCGEKIRVERMFDHFVLLETVGLGGMGTVYKARDTLLDRLVALKLLRKDLEGGIDQSAQLQQEARAAASINHPNVVQVFSSGAAHDQVYLVMELVERGSLDDLIEEKKRVPEELVLETGIQVAKGLRAAHAKGLIHRDVKPANILFADEHTAKIGDFGLAGVAAEARGEIWGTPFYVAPERLYNLPEDFRSDIYSLGATLFHAVAGKAPIEGETNSATELRKLKNEPLLLSVVAPDVSPATARVLNRMIAPEPAQRFSSYDELIAELERAYQTLTGKKIVDVGRSRRRMFAMSVIVLVLVAAALLFVYKSRQQVTGIPLPELERQFNDARHQLLIGKHHVAQAAFRRIANDAKNRQPFYDWARLNEGLAALIASEPDQARDAFEKVKNANGIGFAKEDVDLANFFTTTANRLIGPETIATAAEPNQNGFGAFAVLLFAFKDVAQIDAVDAVHLFEQFLAAQPSGKFGWISDYKPFAQKYLDDCRSYVAWKSESTVENPAVRLERLRAMKKQLKTHGAISEAVSDEEKKLAREIARQPKTSGR